MITEQPFGPWPPVGQTLLSSSLISCRVTDSNFFLRASLSSLLIRWINSVMPKESISTGASMDLNMESLASKMSWSFGPLSSDLIQPIDF